MPRIIDADDAIRSLNLVAASDGQPRAFRRAAMHLDRYANENPVARKVSSIEWHEGEPEEPGWYLCVRRTYIGVDSQAFYRFALDLNTVDKKAFPKHESGFYTWDREQGKHKVDNILYWAFPPEFPEEETEDDEDA